jgi:hypothetical protein
MTIKIYGGMTKDKLMFTFVNHHGKDSNGNLRPPDPERYAIPGGGVAQEREIRSWANKIGYTVRKEG